MKKHLFTKLFCLSLFVLGETGVFLQPVGIYAQQTRQAEEIGRAHV